MSLRGIFAGMLLLTGLEAVVSSEQGTQRFGGILTSVGRGVRYFLDPTVPAIPDRRTSSPSGPGGPLGGIIGHLPGFLPITPLLKGANKGAELFGLGSFPTHAPAPTVTST